MVTQQLLLATHNLGKLREFQAYFVNTEIDLIPQVNSSLAAVEETGLSFIENALLKARHACQHFNKPALADDSGLVVDALGGAPGLYSARYAGKNTSFTQKCQAVIQALDELQQKDPRIKRTAKFICVLALVRYPEDPDPIVCRAQWSGEILHELRGNHGFGYDPILYLPEQKCSVAELDPEVKQTLSHRGQAIKQLLEQLQQEPSIWEQAV